MEKDSLQQATMFYSHIDVRFRICSDVDVENSISADQHDGNDLWEKNENLIEFTTEIICTNNLSPYKNLIVANENVATESREVIIIISLHIVSEVKS
ncbi:CLUMA_CG007759, isoform A [Clunio marinus]|uniref:CLUMA_CG007759, isoform A n=1 Tax=Clunio marinus TaxID=568069 RepID=A0A1J1I3S0_9DIPT|nr:CLUMA_CG007759, isoform A [Clunio marinus]